MGVLVWMHLGEALGSEGVQGRVAAKGLDEVEVSLVREEHLVRVRVRVRVRVGVRGLGSGSGLGSGLG